LDLIVTRLDRLLGFHARISLNNSTVFFENVFVENCDSVAKYDWVEDTFNHGCFLSAQTQDVCLFRFLYGMLEEARKLGAADVHAVSISTREVEVISHFQLNRPFQRIQSKQFFEQNPLLRTVSEE